MTRKCLAAVGLLVCLAAPLRADLKYTTHSELKPAPAADAKPVDPAIAMVGPMMTQQILPNGPADAVYTVSDKGVRVEYIKGSMNGQTEGSVLLALVNGDVIQLNPKDKTYTKTTMTALLEMLKSVGIQPDVTVTPRTETTTIAGVRARRSTVDVTIPLPIPAEVRAQMPGFPAAFTMSGEAWLATTPFEKYVTVMSKMSPATGGLGFAKVAEAGIVLRQVMRSDLFGGQQLETVVTKIGEESVPAGMFEIPAGYKDVTAPIK